MSSQRENPDHLRFEASSKQPTISIRENPTFIQLLDIRDSLFDLLGRKIQGFPTTATASKAFIAPEINEPIRTAIQNLQENALYKAGTDLVLESHLERLDRILSRESRFLKYSADEEDLEEYEHRLRGCKEMLEEYTDRIRGLNVIVGWIEEEVAKNGERAKLKELPLGPYLKEEEEGQ